MDAREVAELAEARRGATRFVSREAVDALRANGSRLSAVIFADVGTLGPAARGRLAEILEAAVEEAIVARGASAPGLGASADRDSSLSDQLFRARHAGARSLVVAVGPLDAIAGTNGVLDPDDGAALAFWEAATRDRPILLLLDERNRRLAAHPSPVRLDELFPNAVVETPRAEATSAPQDTWVDDGSWRGAAEELAASRGPKPLAQVERLFVTKYVPLAEADARGVVDAGARKVREEWAAAFAKSYQEGFSALRWTGKRPPMVIDVPPIAGRIARLHGARTVELLLVDAMRFDLGLRVHERLRRTLEGRAACADRLLLWSALPSTTATQLDLLAHGLDALSRAPEDEGEVVARGRSVTALRRIRVGSRDVLKLDVVEARLRDRGPTAPRRLDLLADEAAAPIARHVESLPERTLLFVFGDHGFVLDAAGDGTGPARQGGASPEEVLVPGFAWLVGGVH